MENSESIKTSIKIRSQGSLIHRMNGASTTLFIGPPSPRLRRASHLTSYKSSAFAKATAGKPISKYPIPGSLFPPSPRLRRASHLTSYKSSAFAKAMVDKPISKYPIPGSLFPPSPRLRRARSIPNFLTFNL